MSDEEIKERVILISQEIKEGKLISQDELVEKIKKW